MAKTKTGLLLPVLAVAGLIAYFGLDAVTDTVGDLLGSNDPVIVADNGHQLLVGGDGKSKVEQCTAQVTLTTRQCGDVKVVVIDAGKMSFIARNIRLAWAEGQPAILHRESANARAKRGKVCGSSFKKTYPRGSCDEFSFASSREGGSGARAEEVHEDEQFCQGGTISSAYQRLPINEGDAYLVVISNPDKIAAAPWAGQEVKVDTCLG
ncbi:NucA/NucB deoxyribonuclease domain-containing protein [Actinokineospora sp.]|uniref:NucA/NucB deoxyribonuclease domain-containing protein n=1 Tax=Actinokineospora sp. TaxID=1872133 RepID=UPI004037CEC3